MAGPDQQGWSAELRETTRHAGIDGRVHWPGMLKGEAKWGAFFAAEAFILPSHQENFGIAVAEALGCGTPVLLADKVNIAQQIANQGAGYVESDTPSGTLQLLMRWINTPAEEKARMGHLAEECFHQRYDMRENAKTIIRLFEAVRQPGETAQASET